MQIFFPTETELERSATAVAVELEAVCIFDDLGARRISQAADALREVAENVEPYDCISRPLRDRLVRAAIEAQATALVIAGSRARDVRAEIIVEGFEALVTVAWILGERAEARAARHGHELLDALDGCRILQNTAETIYLRETIKSRRSARERDPLPAVVRSVRAASRSSRVLSVEMTGDRLLLSECAQ